MRVTGEIVFDGMPRPPLGSAAIVCALAALISCPAAGGDQLPPARVRFATPTRETPDFQRHLVPLIGKLGCNGRACHGSFQGQGGFRLSLFGYDFEMDASALGQRVNQTETADSLLLMKPTERIDHEGGRRIELDSWQYRLVEQWIAGGAAGTAEPMRLERLEVDPPEITLSDSGESVALRVVAVWSDQSREDVTCLTRFMTHNEAVATASADGRIEATGQGDTHIVAFYDNGIAAIPVMIPHAPADPQRPEYLATTEIDRHVNARLIKLGIVPSPPAGDAAFLRRASLDLTGTLPRTAEVLAFIADGRADKRAMKIDELLQRPAYAAWWATRFCDYTGCNPFQQSELGQDLALQWYEWIYRRVADNVPYDQWAAQIVLAVGREPDQDYADYARQMSSYFRSDDPAHFAERQTLPHYWTRRNLKEPKDKSLAFAHSFLGIRLQCAECHKHPYDQWTQEDFGQLAAFFDGLHYGVAPESRAQFQRVAGDVGVKPRGNSGEAIRPELVVRAQSGAILPWRELYVAPPEQVRRLRLLSAGIVDVPAGQDPRQTLTQWMREPDNPYFARVLVNRVWANYFHVGIVEPTDDLNRANPPSNPELLDYLAQGFVQNGYDLKWLHREIANSATYQRDWRPNDSNRNDRRNFSRAIPRRLPAEVLYDAMKQATAADDQSTTVRNDLSRRAVGHLSLRLAGTYAMEAFGKPERAINCDCERAGEPTLLQAIFTHNDPIVSARLAESGWLEELRSAQRELNAGELVDQAYLRTVCRLPNEPEKALALDYVQAAETPVSGLEDLLWALMNAKEFLLNH